MRTLLVTLVAAAGLTLAGCGHPPAAAPPTPAADPLGSLEASVDAVAGQVDADSSG